jgi:uncharacterized membrane protein
VPHILVPDHPDWNLGSQLTIEAWVYPTGLIPNNGHGIVFPWKWDTGSTNQRSTNFGCSGGSGSDFCAFGVSGDGTSSSADGVTTLVGVVTVNKWQFLAAAFDAGLARSYPNGSRSLRD